MIELYLIILPFSIITIVIGIILLYWLFETIENIFIEYKMRKFMKRYVEILNGKPLDWSENE